MYFSIGQPHARPFDFVYLTKEILHMKTGTFFIAFMLIGSAVMSQEIQMTQGARKSYVKKEKEPAVIDARAQDAQKTQPIATAYAALEVKMHDLNGPVGIDLETGNRELNPRTAKVSYEELQKLARNLVPYESHIDVLNYLSDSGWEVVSIHALPYNREERVHTTRIYVRQSVMQ